MLLMVVAAMAVGGSFGAFWTYTSRILDPATGEDSGTTASLNGWWYTTSDPDPSPSSPPRDGIVLTIGAVLAVVAAIMLLLSARRANDPPAPRLAGLGAIAFLIGTITHYWITLFWIFDDSTYDPEVTFEYSYRVGVGSWVLLAAGLVALVTVGLLMAPARATPVSQPAFGPGPVAPHNPGYGPTPAYPRGAAGAPGWPARGRPPGPVPGPAWPPAGGLPRPVGAPIR